MPGMNSGLSPSDPTLVAAFRSALLHQGAIAVLMLAFLWLLWATARTWRTAGSPGKAGTHRGRSRGAAGAVAAPHRVRGAVDLRRDPAGAAEDGGGLATQVIEPIAASSPGWVQHLVNWGGTVWSYHPVQAGAASVWIQIGIGAWLIVAARGPWSRLAGAAGVAWGLVVWVFGESFGGIFAPGLSWLTGAPGGVLFYVAAGALIALPEDAWRSPRSGRLLLAGLGVFFAGMALLQAWPGRGFWQGTGHGKAGTLSGMVKEMAATPQPHVLSSLLSGFASVATRYGFAVNLVVVIALAAMGAAFLTGRPPAGQVRGVVRDRVLPGRLGAGPGPRLPGRPRHGPEQHDPADPAVLGWLPGPGPGSDWRDDWGWQAADGEEAGEAVLLPGAGRRGAERRGGCGRVLSGSGAVASARARSVAAAGALAVIVLGAAPMAAAAANRTADPILALAISGDSSSLDLPAPGFSLTDQDGRTVSLASLRGKVVLMTFLDPVCTTDCPIIAQEFKQAGQMLGAQARNVELVAVVANPTYRSTAFTRAFDRQEGLATVPNWLYLTGSLGQLGAVWRHYGVAVENLPAGAMAAHNDLAVVIDPAGRIRQELGADPGPATSGTSPRSPCCSASTPGRR